VLCTVTLPATSCSTSASLTAGSYEVTATYSGDTNHAASTSTAKFTITAVEEATVTTSTVSGASTTTPIPGAGTARSTEIIKDPAHGTAEIVDGHVVYTPADGFVGTDTVTVRVVDADGTVRVITVRIRVTGTTQARAVAHLAKTGTAVILPVLVGTALLLVGSAAVWVGRRRRA
jgi:LPXTG-motif cell wall-anchored protein